MKLSKYDRDGFEVEKPVRAPKIVHKAGDFLNALRNSDDDISVPNAVDLRILDEVSVEVLGTRSISSDNRSFLPKLTVLGKGNLSLRGFNTPVLDASKASCVHMRDCDVDTLMASRSFSASDCKIGDATFLRNALLNSCRISNFFASNCSLTMRHCVIDVPRYGSTVESGRTLFDECVFNGPDRRWLVRWHGWRYIVWSLPPALNVMGGDPSLNACEKGCTFNNVLNNLGNRVIDVLK